MRFFSQTEKGLVESGAVIKKIWHLNDYEASSDDDGVCTLNAIDISKKHVVDVPADKQRINVCRQLTLKPSIVGLSGNVKIYGTDIHNKNISDTVTMPATITTVATNKAFKKIYSIEVPENSATEEDKQKITITVDAGSYLQDEYTLSFASTQFSISKDDITVELEEAGDEDDLALAVKNALEKDEDIAEVYNVSVAENVLTLTVKGIFETDDTITASLEISSDEKLTVDSTDNGVVGIYNYDLLVGYTKKLGLPTTSSRNVNIESYNNNVLDNSVSFSVDENEVSKNMIVFNSDLSTSENAKLETYYIC